MGNLETICQGAPHPGQSNGYDPSLMEAIIETRKEIKQHPRAPTNIKEIIFRLLKIQNFDELYKETKIWKVREPYKFCYVNEAENKDKGPYGLCSIYLYKEKGQFIGFYRGRVSEKGLRDVKNSIYVFANGDYFIGDKQKENYGVYTDSENSYKYQGDWVSGKPHGEGYEQTSKGKYQGYFKYGKKHGKGKFQYAGQENITYEGDFEENQINGTGKLIKPRLQYEYSGQFLKGLKHGQGVQKFKKCSYDGHFYCNKKSGVGRLICDQYEYEGQFFDDQVNGKGKIIKGGKTVEGIWQNGKLQALLSIDSKQ